MGFAKLEEGEDEGGEGERDRSLLVSLLVSLPLSSENMMRLRILFSRRDVVGVRELSMISDGWASRVLPDDIWEWCVG